MPTVAPPDEALKERFARIDERFDRVDEKFDRVDERIVDVDRRVAESNKDSNRQFKEVNRRIAESSEDSNWRFEGVNRRIDENTAEIKSFREEMKAFHTTFQRGNYTLVATMVGAIFTLILKGG
jgi:chromosome segregation ATPase